jgi:hypothetical protein
MTSRLAIDELRDLLSLYFGFGYKPRASACGGYLEVLSGDTSVSAGVVIRALELLPEVVKEYDQLDRNPPRYKDNYCSYCDEE